jgi:hypothetical protein
MVIRQNAVRAGRENIWLSVRTHGLRFARSVRPDLELNIFGRIQGFKFICETFGSQPLINDKQLSLLKIVEIVIFYKFYSPCQLKSRVPFNESKERLHVYINPY